MVILYVLAIGLTVVTHVIGYDQSDRLTFAMTWAANVLACAAEVYVYRAFLFWYWKNAESKGGSSSWSWEMVGVTLFCSVVTAAIEAASQLTVALVVSDACYFLSAAIAHFLIVPGAVYDTGKCTLGVAGKMVRRVFSFFSGSHPKERLRASTCVCYTVHILGVVCVTAAAWSLDDDLHSLNSGCEAHRSL